MNKMVWLLCSVGLLSSLSAMESQDSLEATQILSSLNNNKSPVKVVVQKQSPIKQSSASYKRWKKQADDFNKNLKKLNSMLPSQQKSPSKKVKLSFGLILNASNVGNILLQGLQNDFMNETITAHEYESLSNQIEVDRYNFLRTPPASPRKKPKLS